MNNLSLDGDNVRELFLKQSGMSFHFDAITLFLIKFVTVIHMVVRPDAPSRRPRQQGGDAQLEQARDATAAGRK